MLRSSGTNDCACYSFTTIILGVGAACAADYAPRHVAILERWGGGLLVGGLALLGVALESALPIIS
jgi:hypothetical protein